MSHYEVVENKVAVDRVVISTALGNSRGSLYFLSFDKKYT